MRIESAPGPLIAWRFVRNGTIQQPENTLAPLGRPSVLGVLETSPPPPPPPGANADCDGNWELVLSATRAR